MVHQSGLKHTGTSGKGVPFRHGCSNLFIDKVMREAKGFWMFREVKLSMGDVGVLRFADDTILKSETEDGNLQVLSDVLTRWELKVNWRKTKVMKVAGKAEECEIKIADKSLEQVDAMKYLGVFICLFNHLSITTTS